MSAHHETGKAGEARAAEFLRGRGYEILERNWRFRRAEIDIIARKDAVIVFVEVKTRSNIAFGFPEESVSRRKQKLMAMAAEEYCDTHNAGGECRFDVISVYRTGEDTWQTDHFEDAFFLYGNE